MKTILKTTFMIGVFLFAFKSHAQAKHINQLTLTEYEAIAINGVNWEAIPSGTVDEHNNVDDIIHKMEKLFGKHHFSIEKGTEPSLYIDFWYGWNYFHFEDRSDTGNHYGLASFWIKQNTLNIRIKGTTLTIGDPIGKLGKIKTYMDEGTKIASFACKQCDDKSSIIHIFFDSNNRIEEIVVYNLMYV